jgi:hypothetical protein
MDGGWSQDLLSIDVLTSGDIGNRLHRMRFDWNEEKNELLKRERGVCFEDVVVAVDMGHLLSIERHPDRRKYPSQFMMIVAIRGYPCRVPFVWKDDGTAFLKTIYPSRKEKKQWGRR